MFIHVEMKMVGLKSNVLKILFHILMSVKREFQGYKDMRINILAVLSARREERAVINERVQRKKQVINQYYKFFLCR